MSKCKWNLLTALSIGALLAGSPAWGDEEKTDAKSEESSENEDQSMQIGASDYVSVRQSHLPSSNSIATKMAVPLQVIPANVGTVGQLLLSEQGAVSLNDAVLNVSGVHPQTGFGVHDYFLIRGFDSLSSGLVMTDGAAEPEVTKYHLYNVEGVEILKGPAGFLYGANPLAGVVNIVRKQPTAVSFLDVRATVGSFDTLEGAFDWNVSDQDGERSFRLNSFWRESANFRDNMDSSHFAINPSFSMKLGDDANLNFNIEYVDAQYQPDSGIPLYRNELPDVPLEQSYQSVLDFSDQQATRLQMDYSNALSDRLELRVKVYYRQLDWESDGTLINGVVPNFQTFAPEVSRTLTRLDDQQQLFGTQVEAVYQADTGSIHHDLLAGIEISQFEDDYTLGVELFLQNLDLFNPVEPDNPWLFPLPSQGQAGNAKSVVIAPYVVDQIRFSDRFQMLLGARWDEISYEDPTSSIDRDDSELSPMLGLVFTPSTELTFYGNAAQSHAPASPRTIGDREPEQSTQFEIGIKKKFQPGRMQATLAAYQIDRENIAIVDDTGFTQQTGDQRSQGVELELAAEPWQGGRAFLSYAYNDAELTSFKELAIVGFDPATGPIFGVVDRSGNTPAFAPEHLFRLWVAHSFQGGWGVGAGIRYFSEQFIAEDNVYEIDAAALLDATVSYSVADWKLRLNFKNLTDEEVPTRGFASTAVIPAPGVAAYLSAEYRIR